MLSKAHENRLIRRAQRGDGAAIEELIREHQGALYGFMVRLSGRPDVAEDMVQEAFVRVIKNIGRFDTRFRFSTWIFTIGVLGIGFRSSRRRDGGGREA
jgi:RNA polymerase sigma-70 factor (ECF subfamily)